MGVPRAALRLLRKDDRSYRTARAKQEHDRLLVEFKARSPQLGLGDLSSYYWYHTVDLGNGVVTPGDYDYRGLLSNYAFPTDMRGMTVLDVGSATGFFAFEFEKRGATVVSVELPSLVDWDIPPVDKEAIVANLMKENHVSTLEDLDRVFVHGPFDVCHKALHSNVTRCYSRIYDLTPRKLGHGPFDVIFCGDILLHLFAPLAALAVLAPLCAGALIVAQGTPRLAPDEPLMSYQGGDARGRTDSRTWWLCNRLCLEQMLKRVGFAEVRQVGMLPLYPGRGGQWWMENQAVFHATKPK